MARTPRITEAQIAEALRKNGGILSSVAAAFRISSSEITRRIQNSPALQAVRYEAQESVLDLAESKLIQNIQKNDNTAIIFFLKTKGKHRGYVERQEVTGANGQPLEVNVTDIRKRVEGELDRIAAQQATDGVSTKIH